VWFTSFCFALFLFVFITLLKYYCCYLNMSSLIINFLYFVWSITNIIRYECYAYVCNNINTTGTTCGTGTSYPTTTHGFTPGFRVSWSLVLRVVFWTLLFALLSFSICPLYCLSIYDFLLPLWCLQTIYNTTETVECGI